MINSKSSVLDPGADDHWNDVEGSTPLIQSRQHILNNVFSQDWIATQASSTQNHGVRIAYVLAFRKAGLLSIHVEKSGEVMEQKKGLHITHDETRQRSRRSSARDFPPGEKLEDSDIRLYQELLGSFNWLATLTMPDIAYSVGKLASSTSGATQRGLKHLKKLLAYLRDHESVGISMNKASMKSKPCKLYAFSDASFGNEKDRKSRSGYIIYVDHTPPIWKSNKQKSLVASTHWAEWAVLNEKWAQVRTQ